MKELIPSKDVRNYLQKLGRKFNDFECTTLIYNSDMNRVKSHIIGLRNVRKPKIWNVSMALKMRMYI